MIVAAYMIALIAAGVFTSPFRRHFPPYPEEFAWSAGILLAAMLVRRSPLTISLVAPTMAGCALAMTPIGWTLNALTVGLTTSFLLLTLTNLPFPSLLDERRGGPPPLRTWIGIVPVVVLMATIAFGVVFAGGLGPSAIIATAILVPLATTILIGWTAAMASDRIGRRMMPTR
jgi:hypothetical protein